jgi:hypothetical protein
MKKLLFAAALALAPMSVGLASCETLREAVSPTTDEKALITAELGFQALQSSLQAGVRTGKLKGEKAQRARVLNAEAKAALNIARFAQRVGDAASAQEANRVAEIAIKKVQDILKEVN